MEKAPTLVCVTVIAVFPAACGSGGNRTASISLLAGQGITVQLTTMVAL